jgi:glucose/mannose-6-phosphate isomerase
MKMINLVEQFPQQLEKAVQIGEYAQLSASKTKIKNVIISGLGGSGIGGSIVKEWVENESQVPIIINKGYFLPAFANEESLVIVSTYSGNTEETLQVLHSAIEKRAKIVVITSGGKAQQIAQQKAIDCIIVPGGFPPRSCLGYSITQLLYILKFHQIITSHFIEKLKSGIHFLIKNQQEIIIQAKDLTQFLKNKRPVVYAEDSMEAVLIRFRQQFNENSKMLGWHHVFPEMCHNELVGWRENAKDLAVVIFRTKEDFLRNQYRIDICKKTFETHTTIKEIWGSGLNKIENALFFIHLGDFTSCFLADENGFEASEIDVIYNLKNQLDKI